MSAFCPHCGQQSLSSIDKSGWDSGSDDEISMELFEKKTEGTSAPRERKVSSRRPRGSGSGMSRPAFLTSLSTGKLIAIGIATALAATYATYLIAPNVFPSSIRSAIYKSETTALTILPKSEAYRLGFEKGSYYAGLEEGLGTIDALFKDYELGDPSTSLTPERMTPELISELAAAMWKMDGLLSMLENSESNQADYEEGFQRGYFG